MGFKEMQDKGSIKVRELPDLSKPIYLYFGGNGVLNPKYRYYSSNGITVPPLDFGEALYLADNERDSEFWAIHSCLMRTSSVPTSTCFEFNPEGLKGYVLREDYKDESVVLSYIANLLKFAVQSPGLELDFDKDSIYLEYSGFDVNDYDYIVAPRLDSCYFRILWHLCKNDITVGEFAEALKHNIYEGYQVCIISEKAHKALKNCGSKECVNTRLIEEKEEKYNTLKEKVLKAFEVTDKTKYTGTFTKTIKDLER